MQKERKQNIQRKRLVVFDYDYQKNRPEKIWVDEGIELAGEFKKLCIDEGIQYYSTMSETKVAFA